jgi:hypothetical protein
LKQSISTGCLELIKLVRERLSGEELRDRVGLSEVAAVFRQERVLKWLLRDATEFERELLGVFALERKLADSLVIALGNVLQPWWRRTREVSLKWRASSGLEFVAAPEGYSSEGGWWTALSGAASALQGLGGQTSLGPTLHDRAQQVRSAVKFECEWTKAMSQTQLGDPKLVKSVVFPPGVTAIGEKRCTNLRA